MIYDGQVQIVCEKCCKSDYLQLSANQPLNTLCNSLGTYATGEFRKLDWLIQDNGCTLCPRCAKKKGASK